MDDLTKAIAFEVKQEMAERYFGMRTRIETRSQQYLEQLQQLDHSLTEAIGLDLLRMRAIFSAPDIFHAFLTIIDLPSEDAITLCRRPTPFPQKAELFRHLRCWGLTRRQRFRSLATAVYCSLAKNIASYHEVYLQLEQEQEEICAEIEKFQRQNDLSDILSFLRTLDSDETDRKKHLHAEAGSGQERNLDTALRLTPPPPAAAMLLQLRLLPPLPQIKDALNKLMDAACARNLGEHHL